MRIGRLLVPFILLLSAFHSCKWAKGQRTDLRSVR